MGLPTADKLSHQPAGDGTQHKAVTAKANCIIEALELGDFSENRFTVRNWPTDNGGKERSVANGIVIITKNSIR